MQTPQINLAKALTYCGTIPFLAALALHFIPLPGLDSHIVASTYATAIISFICGIHWAAYLFFADRCPHNLLLTSNVITLVAWAALLLDHGYICGILQVLCFLALLGLDINLRKAGLYPDWFFTLRRNATVIVVLALAGLTAVSG